MEGTVNFFNELKGFGFITGDEDDVLYFVHVSGLVDMIGEGDFVSFDLVEGKKGHNAVNVNIISSRTVIERENRANLADAQLHMIPTGFVDVCVGDICSMRENKELYYAYSDEECKRLANEVVIDGVNYLHVTVQAVIEDGDYFILDGVITRNSSPMTKEICKSEQSKVIATTDERLGLPGIPKNFVMAYTSYNGDIENLVIEWDLRYIDQSYKLPDIKVDRPKVKGGDIIIVNYSMPVGEVWTLPDHNEFLKQQDKMMTPDIKSTNVYLLGWSDCEAWIRNYKNRKEHADEL